MINNYTSLGREGFWEEKLSYRGQHYNVWRHMPRIDDLLMNTVFYVYPTAEDAEIGSEFGGTGFFLMIPLDGYDHFGFIYAISNVHVIFGIKSENIYLRINTQDEKFDIIETKKSDWVRHPDGDDIAVCNIKFKKDFHKEGYFSRTHFITKKFIDENNVGVGDEIIMIGRFRVHAGKNKNLPVAMFGCISQMPKETLHNPFTKCNQESFLVEMKSIKGFSGSPVIVYIPAFSNRFDGSTLVRTRWEQRLLGIDWGQIQYETIAVDEHGQNYKLKIDSAIAGVVPAWKILDIIDSKEFVEMRKKEKELYEKEIEDSEIMLTSETKDDEVLTKERFENILKKVSRIDNKEDKK